MVNGLHVKCFSGQLDHSKSAFSHSHTHSYSGGGGYLCGRHLPIRAGSNSVQGSVRCSRTLQHVDVTSWCAAAVDRCAWPLWPLSAAGDCSQLTVLWYGGYDRMGSLTLEAVFPQMTAFSRCLCFPSNVIIMIFVLMSDTVAVEGMKQMMCALLQHECSW